jgi:hypothetical protein
MSMLAQTLFKLFASATFPFSLSDFWDRCPSAKSEKKHNAVLPLQTSLLAVLVSCCRSETTAIGDLSNMVELPGFSISQPRSS